MRKSNIKRSARGRRNCKQIFALLSEYLDGKLPLRNCAQIEKHMGGCAPCRAFLDSLRDSVELCRRYRDERLDPNTADRTRRQLLAACRKAGVSGRRPAAVLAANNGDSIAD